MDIQAELQRGIAAHQTGDIETAGAAYKAVLQEDPDNPDALHFGGLLSYQAGDPENAVTMIRRSLELFPANAGAHNNLGNILKALDRREEAVDAYQTAVGIDPTLADAWCNVGVLLRSSEQFQPAINTLERAVELQPDHAEAWHNLGLTFMLNRQLEKAAEAFEACVNLGFKRWSDPVWHARVLCALGRRERAVAHLEAKLAEDPDNAVTAYQLAALRGDDLDKADATYVKEHFDSFSNTFDDVLKGLQYRAPEIVAEVVDGLMEGRPPVPDVADLGCGTGLVGPLIRQHCTKLTGIDLSPGMLRHAAKRACYDYLVEGELVAFLNDAPRNCFDLAVCVDTLCYFGTLTEFMTELNGALKPGGVMVATVERVDDPDGPDHVLDESGRYAHHERHLRAATEAASMTMHACTPVVLRQELGSDVLGYVFTVQKTAT
ncbi:MAG: tetratricopeptide repeat protein [Pseudomonadota bacterium]